MVDFVTFAIDKGTVPCYTGTTIQGALAHAG